MFMKNIKVKEFNSSGFIEDDVNKFLQDNKNLEIVDIKYCADMDSANALIIYRSEE